MKALSLAALLCVSQFALSAHAATACEDQVASDARAKLESEYIIKDMKTLSVHAVGDRNVAVLECTTATKGGAKIVKDEYEVDITNDCHVKDDMRELARMFDEQ